MKRDDYLKMLIQDIDGEEGAEKELHEAVLECAAEALSQMRNDFDINGAVGLEELWGAIVQAGKESKAQCVSPFRAAEIIAEKLGVQYVRPIHQLRAILGDAQSMRSNSVHKLEDLI